MRAWTLAGGAALFAALVFNAGNVSAQTAVCSATPGKGERIECTEPSTSSTDISLIPRGIDIDTTEDGAPGVHGHHEGTGDIFIDLQSGLDENGDPLLNDIDTSGDSSSSDESHGVYARHVGSGNVDIGAQNSHITTTGDGSHGVNVYLGYRPSNPPPTDPPPEAAGNIDIDISGSTIETQANSAHGVFVEHYGGAGWIDMTVRNSTVTTYENGIAALGRGTATGDIDVTVENVNITTVDRSARGVHVDHDGENTANITINVERGSITTGGFNGFAISGIRNQGSGNLDIDVVGTVINTTDRKGYGIYAYMPNNEGDIDVYAEDIDFTSTGEEGHGIRNRFQ